MRKIITAAMVAALLTGSAASPVLAGSDYGYGHSYYGGHHYKHRPYYGYRDRHRYRHGGGFHLSGDGAVVLGILAGAVVLGALLSQPPPPARPPVLRSPDGAPLGGCLRTTGTGAWNGRPARFSGTMCYDLAGRAYVIPGSARFMGYLR